MLTFVWFSDECLAPSPEKWKLCKGRECLGAHHCVISAECVLAHGWCPQVVGMKWSSRKSTMANKGAGIRDFGVRFAQSSLWSQLLLLSQAPTLSLNACVSFLHVGAGVMRLRCRKCSEEKREWNWWLLWGHIFSAASLAVFQLWNV